jgi:hypothetical protein
MSVCRANVWDTEGSISARRKLSQNCLPMTDNSPRRPSIRDGTNDWRCHRITKMPAQSSITQIRLDNIIICLNAAVTTVEAVSKGFKTPFLQPIVNTVVSLLGAVQVIFRSSGGLKLTNTHQKIKKNKDVCTEMLERIYKVLYGIIQVHMASDTGGELTPKMLNNMGQFAE